MVCKRFTIENIPVIVWGEQSDKVYLFVHGKMSDKESAKEFAKIANSRGYQVLSFDLPEHGERKDTNYKCNIWNGIQDLKIIGDYVHHNWSKIYLFGCSLGAFFSLHAYNNLHIEKCLFQSPILDMEHLVHNMFNWFDVTEELLQKEKEIFTPIDTLSWDYYRYIKEHPIDRWTAPTYILYGSEDKLQSRIDVDSFTQKFNCNLTVSIGSDHPFGSENEAKCVIKWLYENI